MKKGTDAILVTGATGTQGGALAAELLAAGHRVLAMTRKPDAPAAQALKSSGATVVQGDLNDEASLRAAAKGVWGMFAVQNTWEAGVEGEEEQGHRQARLAREAGIQHYVYASVASADKRTGIPHFDNKARVEETVRGLGFPSFAIVRPVFFMDNLLTPWFKPGIDDGKLYMGLPATTRLQMIARRDIGKYLFSAFERHQEWNGKAVDIAGDELTMPEAAALISSAAGRTVTHVPVPIAEVRKMSEDYALMLEWFVSHGYTVDIAATSKQWGVQPTSFAAWAGQVSW